MKKTLALILTFIMVLALVPTVAFAETYVAWIGEKGYETLEAAVKAAESGDTITLGEGKYTLYGVSSDDTTKGKNLTFVGQGVEKTTWIIGAEVPDPNKSGTEYNSDYSFSGASVTFKDMTLNSYYSKEDKNKSGYENYLGFAHTVNTLVDSCVINGVTAYWGYTSAAFRNTTFNAPVGGYALWSYSSAIMTFDNCTFNSSGKVINVYNEGYTTNVTVNFNNCTVKNTGTSKKAVLNINDRYVSGFTINISGNNSVDGITADNMTCSCLFGFGGKEKNPENVNGTLYYSNNNKTVVTINGVKVWENGERVCAHNGVVFPTGSYNGNQATQYTDGYKDNAFDTTASEWTTNADGTISRTVTKKCKYCGYQENITQLQVKLTYDANGGEGTIDSATGAAGESVNVAENVFTRNNYTFTGWNTQADGKGTAYKAGDSFTLTDKDTVLYAQWSKNSGSAGTGTNGTAKPTDSPKTGDNSNLALWFALLLVSGGAAIGTTVVSRKKKYNR